MSLKVIGGVLIVAGCGGFGFLMAASYRREIRMLRDFQEVICYMICQLEYRQLPLPQLIRDAAGRCTREIGAVLSCLASELEAQIAPDASSCMEAAIRNAPALSPRTEMLLRQLGSTLGAFDLHGQITSLRTVQSSCAAELEKMELDRDQRIRSYQTLGLCAGAALVILFV